MNEKEQARQFGLLLDQWIGQGGPAPATREGAGDLIAAAAPLIALCGSLPPPEPGFEQRVWRQVRTVQQPARGGWLDALTGRRTRWLAPLAAALLLVLLVLPGPRSALSKWVGSIRLGSVDVVVAPELPQRPALTDQIQQFASLEDARQSTGMALAAPASLPDGFALAGVQAVSLEELPAWLRPLFVESRYQRAGGPAGDYLLLRQYNASRSDQGGLGEVEYQSDDVGAVRQLTLDDGTPAVLLVLGQDDAPLHELIWQRDGVTFELWGNGLSVEALLETAGSVALSG